MSAQILFVAPFEELFQTANIVVKEQFADDIGKIEIIKGDLEECLAKVKLAVDDGVEVVVSRGGTAGLIEENVTIPVVPVQVSMVDILRAIVREGKNYDKVGIAGFKNVIYGCEEMEELLHMQIYEIPLCGEKEAEVKIAEAMESGIRLIVGDVISTKVAKRLGIDGVLIHSGREAVFKAIKEAEVIAKIRREEQEKSALLRTVIDQSAEGIIGVDCQGRITIFNPMAEKLFKVSHLEAVGKPIEQILPDFHRADEKFEGDYFADVMVVSNKTFTVKKSDLRIKNEPMGELFNLQNVSQLQQLEQNIRKKLHKKGLVAKVRMNDIVGESAACANLKRKAARYALTQSTILVTGESGTGKEMIVQSIHNCSARSDGPFVAVNCAALPENLLESELFGYEEGAFTGAKRGGRQGLFELAHGGTLFLDEIGEMPMALQSRLLRVLQEKAIMHIGGDSVIPVDVRIIAATNQDLPKMVEAKTFREDLYYRLNILRIQMPTLQERMDDIPLLAKEMVRKMHMVNSKITGIDLSALAYLKNCQWPGNIRQLANTMERVMLLCEGTVITRQSIVEALDSADELRPMKQETPPQSGSLKELENQALERVLAEENFNYQRAAQRLGIHRTTLWRKLNKK